MPCRVPVRCWCWCRVPAGGGRRVPVLVLVLGAGAGVACICEVSIFGSFSQRSYGVLTSNYNELPARALLAVRVVETGCRCWVPGAGAGCARGGDRVPVLVLGCWLCAWWRQGAGCRCGVPVLGAGWREFFVPHIATAMGFLLFQRTMSLSHRCWCQLIVRAVEVP